MSASHRLIESGRRSGFVGSLFCWAVLAAWPLSAQTPEDISPFPEASLQSIDPVESLPPPLDEEEPPADRVPSDPPTLVPPPVQDRDGLHEVVRERYPDGRIKVERQVALDPDENFVNHGSYRMLDPQGLVIAEGAFQYGRPEGPWRRWVAASEAEWLTKPPFSLFQAPFYSEASFRDGKLNGTWRLSDRLKRKVFEIGMADGRREGQAVWYAPQGHPLRETSYHDGLPHGVQRTWQSPEKGPQQDLFERGRRVSQEIDYYPNKQKKSDGAYYHGQLVLISEDDWWTMKLVTYESQNDGYRQGVWRVWYSNGQLQMQGEYDKDAPTGRFAWWHVNGQVALQGEYRKGQRDGRWMWWHANGVKRSHGAYTRGAPLGDWAWWSEEGKLTRKADFPHPLRNLDESIPVDTDAETLPLKPVTRLREPSQ